MTQGGGVAWMLSFCLTGVALAAVTAPVAIVLATVVTMTGPVLAMGAAVYFVWTRVWQVKWLALGVLICFALYGAATAGAMLRLVAAP